MPAAGVEETALEGGTRKLSEADGCGEVAPFVLRDGSTGNVHPMVLARRRMKKLEW